MTVTFKTTLPHGIWGNDVYQYVDVVIEILNTRCEIMAATKQVQNYANTAFCWPEVKKGSFKDIFAFLSQP